MAVGRYYPRRSEEHTSELQSLMRISYAVFCLKKKKTKKKRNEKLRNVKHRMPNSTENKEKEQTFINRVDDSKEYNIIYTNDSHHQTRLAQRMKKHNEATNEKKT